MRLGGFGLPTYQLESLMSYLDHELYDAKVSSYRIHFEKILDKDDEPYTVQALVTDKTGQLVTVAMLANGRWYADTNKEDIKNAIDVAWSRYLADVMLEVADGSETDSRPVPEGR